MSDTNNGQEFTEGTVAPMPSAEQPAEDAQEPQLPDGVRERTAEEFEKLKAHNKQMADELVALKGSNPHTSVLDELRPNLDLAPTAPISMAGFQQPAPQAPFVDKEGYVDAGLLNSTLTKAQKEAEDAKRIAQQTQQSIQRFQESQVVQAVHSEFPQLDPNNPDQFDPAFYDFVKNDLIGQMMQGKEDLRAAALKAKQVLGQKQAVSTEQRKETISSRDQASATTGTGHSTPPTNDQASLVEGTYKGDKDAIFKRLQASGY